MLCKFLHARFFVSQDSLDLLSYYYMADMYGLRRVEARTRSHTHLHQHKNCF